MLALLHTSPVHVPVFDALRDEEAPDLTLHHLVRPELLERARAQGPEAVAEDVAAALAEAARDGARAALCTCSTIGSVAEAAGAALGLPVLRVDRPMARRPSSPARGSPYSPRWRAPSPPRKP